MKICPRCSELLPDDAGFCPFDGAVLESQADKFLGKVIAARYRLTKKLGSGGMSVVYLARHELISRLSAIKILRPELARIAEHRERFLREARAVNRINHENIVEISDVGESDGIAYLVMEYVEGESLLNQIQKGPLPWERAVRIALQVASALARTHQTGIIHRDLKPENILLVQKVDMNGLETDELVKLTDFGIAKMMGEPTLTFNEQLFGTPGYIAPEYVGGVAIDGRADIYSLGVVLYEMLTSRLPFEGRGQSDLLLKPLTQDPIPPSKRVQGLPEELEALLLRVLSRDPDQRPHDAFALHDLLSDFLKKKSESPPSVVFELEQRVVREPLETIVDRTSASMVASQRATADVGQQVTNEMSSRWSTALAELETLIARAHRAGHTSREVKAATELAMVATEMIPRVERATKIAAELQQQVDKLEAIGREFRASLGNAVDVLVHDRSREWAHLDALRGRRDALARSLATQPPNMQWARTTDARPWELEALKRELARSENVVNDVGFQIDTLQKQLDERNEAHDRAIIEATGRLEGSLSALRRLTTEIVRTIEDGIDLLQKAS